MTTAELQTVEDQVLSWIRAAEQPVSTTELIEQQGDDHVSGEAVRRAVWNLVDRGMVKYDYSWRLSPASHGER